MAHTLLPDRQSGSLTWSEWVGIGWCCLALVVLYLFPHQFKSLNQEIYDLKLRLFSRASDSTPIVHVDVDDKALAKIGRWPWDRKVSARIIDRLTDYGAKVLVFDIFYTSKGRTLTGDEALFSSLVKSGRVVMPLVLSPADDRPQVRPETTHSPREQALYRRAWTLKTPHDFDFFRVKNRLTEARLPLVPIIEHAHRLGTINAAPDSDGTFRRIPLVIQYRDRFLPCLSLAAATAYWGVGSDAIRVNGNYTVQIRRSDGVVSIPVDARANMVVNWRPIGHDFPTYSVMDLLAEAGDPAIERAFRGKIVVIAVSWFGNKDVGVSPLKPEFQLSRIHSNGLATILTARFIREISPFPVPVMAAIGVWLLFLWSQVKTRYRYGILMFFTLLGLMVIFVAGTFAIASLELPIAEALFLFAPGAVACLAVNAISTELRLGREVRHTQEAAILALAKLAESRDEETGSHLIRIRHYCNVLCERAALRPAFHEQLTPEFIGDLVRSSILHDIGKVGIADSILCSTEKFSSEDFEAMKQHTLIGGRALEEAVEKLGTQSFLSVGAAVAYYHHERWDGTGYPYGLEGEQIPLSARIVALADVFDALTTQRRYKKAFSFEEARAIIVDGSGKHFDPALVEVYLEVQPELERIRESIT
jgi:adenylate cyclase